MANDLNVKLGADIDGLQSGLDKAGKELTKFENKIKNLAKVGDQMKGIGKKMSVGISLPLVALGTLAVKTFADFSQEMAKVQAISGATASEMDSLRKSAEDLGSSTRYSATEVAGLQLNLSKLGFDTQAINNSTEAILNLALATGEDLAQSASVAASVMQGFGLEADEAGRVTDVMAASFSASALDLNKFKIAMASVAPVASRAGQSIESTTSMLSILTNTGLEASVAGTSLRNIFLQLSKQGLTMEDAFDSINKSADKSKRAMELFGVQGATAAVVLAENADAAKDFTKQYQNAGGAAEKMAKVMDNTLTGSMASLKSASEGAMIAIGEQLAPTIQKLAKGLTSLISKFRDLSPTMQKVIVVTGGIAAAIGPILVVMGTLATTVIPGLILTFVKLNAVMLANPYVALAAGIIALTSAIYLMTRASSQASQVQKTLNDVRVTAAKNIASERAEMDTLLRVAKDETRSKIDRQGAIDKINDIYPSYIENITLDTVNTDKATKANDLYNKSINERALQTAAMTRKSELYQQRFEVEAKSLRASGIQTDKFWKLFGVQTNDFKGIEEFEAYVYKLKESGRDVEALTLAYAPIIKKREEELSAIDAQIDSLDQYIIVTKNAKKATDSLDLGGGVLSSGGGRGIILPISVNLNPEGIKQEFIKVNELIDEQLDAFGNNYIEKVSAQAVRMAEINIELSEGITSILEQGLQNGLADAFAAIGGTIADGGNVVQSLSQSILSSVGGVLMDLGKLALAVGVGLQAIKTALTSLNPVAAIAAGVGLIALGSFFKGQAKSIGNSMGSGGGGSPQSTGSVGSTQAPRQTTQAQSGGFGGGTVVFEIEGQRLVGVLKNTLDRNRRSGGNLSFS